MSARRGHRDRIHVLVVEDDFLVAKEVIRCLRDAGYSTISEATNGAEAVQLVADVYPDVVLMDLEMPVMGGIEATARIQEVRPTPVVVLTAYESELESAARSGAAAYLTKPPDPGTLDRAITVALARHAELVQLHARATALEAELKQHVLKGLLPMCARCKSIRDAEGTWTDVEVYIREHTQAQVTHGICHTCARELYPEAFDESW